MVDEDDERTPGTPRNPWYIWWFLAVLLFGSWILSDKDRTGQPYTTPVWARCVIAGVTIVAMGLVQRWASRSRKRSR